MLQRELRAIHSIHRPFIDTDIIPFLLDNSHVDIADARFYKVVLSVFVKSAAGADSNPEWGDRLWPMASAGVSLEKNRLCYKSPERATGISNIQQHWRHLVTRTTD